MTATQAPFTIDDYSMEAIGRRGLGTVNVRVFGYWSRDSATLYIERKQGWLSSMSHLPFEQHPHSWVCTMTHGSGGRDPKEVGSDLDAAQNFGAGLVAMAELGRSILARSEELEAFYQDQRRLDKVEADCAAAERQALIDADAGLGDECAEQLLEAARQRAKSGNGEFVIAARERGNNGKHTNFVVRFSRRSGITSVSVLGQRLSWVKAVDLLATHSHNSTID